MITYPIGTSGEVLLFSDEVLRRFNRHRQNRFWKREAGGQLFAKIIDRSIDVTLATGPRSTDKRGRTSYVPDRAAEQREIDKYSQQGYTFIGDWHTHPEEVPSPSHSDIASINDTVRNSVLGLRGLVLVIVGMAAVPDSLYVAVCDTKAVYSLAPGE